MQVKKFEAKTMKEALQMVKEALGPEAIILSAKDHKKSFGLAGGGSIEITAAISEKSLSKKQYVENRLQPKAKEQFRTQSAKAQKTYIENSIARRTRVSHLDPRAGIGAVAQRPMTSRRYIDIADEEENVGQAAALSGRRVDDLLSEFVKPSATIKEEESKDEVTTLREEVYALRDLLSQMQKSGATGMNTTQYPGAEHGFPFELSANFEKLQNAGLDNKYIVEILGKANSELTALEKKRRSLVDAWVARFILSHTQVLGNWSQNQNSSRPLVHLFFGPSGQGKTSALVKMATQFMVYERKRVVILSADTFKVGATDQVKIYAQILNAPFEIVKHSIEFSHILKKYSEADVILVDYPGLALKDIQEIDQLRYIMPSPDISTQKHLVLSCSSKDQDAYEMGERYQVTHFDDLIITKIDESHSHGFLFNIQKNTGRPLCAFGLGTKIPEDIELATRERVLDLIYEITKK